MEGNVPKGGDVGEVIELKTSASIFVASRTYVLSLCIQERYIKITRWK